MSASTGTRIEMAWYTWRTTMEWHLLTSTRYRLLDSQRGQPVLFALVLLCQMLLSAHHRHCWRAVAFLLIRLSLCRQVWLRSPAMETAGPLLCLLCSGR